MPAEEVPEVTGRRESASYLEVRKAAARTAVSASKITGRPGDPRVQELADLCPPRPRRVESGWRRVFSRWHRR